MSVTTEIGSARNSSNVQQKEGTGQKSSKVQYSVPNQSSQLTNNNNQGANCNYKFQSMQNNNNNNPNSIRISILKEGGYNSIDSYDRNRNNNNGNNSSKSNSNSSKNNQYPYQSGMNFNAVTRRYQQSQHGDSSESDTRLSLLRLIYMKKLHNRLYEKFSQSQNYYYTRDVSDLLAGSRTSFTIQYKDQLAMDEQEEYLKRIYQRREYPNKIKHLTEYYKFHSDLPRLFMQHLAPIMDHMHVKKRRIEFNRIAKMFEEENKKNPTKPRKDIVGDVPAPNTEESLINRKEKESGKNLEKGLSMLLQDISSFVNKDGGDQEIIGIGKNKEENRKNGGRDIQEDSKNRCISITTAERLNRERKQILELKEQQILQAKQKQQQQQKQQQGDQSIMNNNNNDESNLSVMHSRLRDILQVSSMSQSSMQSEATIQDISENHGLDDFLKFLSKQPVIKGGSSMKIISQQQINMNNYDNNNNIFNQVSSEQQAIQLTLLSPAQISISKSKVSQPQSQNEQQQQVNNQREQQQQQLNLHTKTIVASLGMDFQKQQSQVVQYDQERDKNKNMNQLTVDEVRKTFNQQPQSQQSQTTHLSPNNIQQIEKQNNINSNPQSTPRSSYSMQLQFQQRNQQQLLALDEQPQVQLKQQQSSSSSSSQQQISKPKTAKFTSESIINRQQSARISHNDPLMSCQPALELKSNLNSNDQTVMTRSSATTSLKNSFGINNNNNINNNSKTSSLGNVNIKINNDNDNNQNIQQNAINFNERQPQQAKQHIGTGSFEDKPQAQQQSLHRAMNVRILHGLPINQGVDSYPLTARTQSNSGNTNYAPKNESAKQTENGQAQVIQQQQGIISSSQSHSRHASSSNQPYISPPINLDAPNEYKQQQQQQQQLQRSNNDPQYQQQYPKILLSNLPNTNYLSSPSNISSSPVATPIVFDQGASPSTGTLINKTNNPSTTYSSNNQLNQQYQQQQQQFKISKLKKNSINSLHSFNSPQQQHVINSPRTVDIKQPEDSGDHIDEQNQNMQQSSRQQIPLNSQKQPGVMSSSHSIRNGTSTKPMSQVNSPNNENNNNNNNNKLSSDINQNGQISSNISAGTVSLASTLSSFKQSNIKNPNEQNNLISPQQSQHNIQMKQPSATQRQQQQQQPQQFSSYLRTASTGFAGNLLIQPSQLAQNTNYQSNTPSGSISARNQQQPIPTAITTTTSSLHQRQHSNPTAGLTKNSLSSLHRFNQSSNTNINLNSAKINSENIYSPHNQDYFQSANSSPVPPQQLTLHSNSNMGSPRSMDTTKPSFFGSTTRTRPSLQSHQQLQVFIQEPQQQQQQQQGQLANKPTNQQNFHKYTKSEAQGMLTQSHTFFQGQEYTNTPSSLAFSAATLNSANSLTSLTERGKLQSKQSKQPQSQQHQQQSTSTSSLMTKLAPVKQTISTKQQLSQHTSQGIIQQQINQLGIPNHHNQQQQQQQQPYQLSNNSNTIHVKNLSPRQQIAFPLTRA